MNTDRAAISGYVLFAGVAYYPGGGWNDYHGSFKTVADAQRAVREIAPDWAHVVDVYSGVKVCGLVTRVLPGDVEVKEWKYPEIAETVE